MTDFITRVDVHEADPAVHDAVDRAMESRNFSKTHLSPRGGRRYDIVTAAGDIAYFLHPAA